MSTSYTRAVRPHDAVGNFVFISVLKDFTDQEEALELLRALAAQVKPICKNNHLYVNSFEEAAWNPEYGGRNWNGGEVIEIVLRGRDGRFLPLKWLLHVVCHELAHNKQMNHSAAFHRANEGLRNELATLRARKYYGDGFWSSGRSLDGLPAASTSTTAESIPEIVCGGANNKKRGGFRRSQHVRRKLYQIVKPGSSGGVVTGRRSAKPGSRLRREMPGQGEVMDAEQSTFRKRTQTKSARQARAEAAEARIAQLEPIKEATLYWEDQELMSKGESDWMNDLDEISDYESETRKAFRDLNEDPEEEEGSDQSVRPSRLPNEPDMLSVGEKKELVDERTAFMQQFQRGTSKQTKPSPQKRKISPEVPANSGSHKRVKSVAHKVTSGRSTKAFKGKGQRLNG